MRIRAGVAFWRDNAVWLQRAEELYGCRPTSVVGLIGVESIYATNGDFRAIDALATLAFDFPAGRRDRSAFFRDELEQRSAAKPHENVDPLDIKAATPAHLGMGPVHAQQLEQVRGRLRRRRQVDMHRSAADVIGSVAHYLAEYGWQRGLPTRFDVAVPVEVSDRARCWLPTSCPASRHCKFRRTRCGAGAERHDPSRSSSTQLLAAVRGVEWHCAHQLAHQLSRAWSPKVRGARRQRRTVFGELQLA